MLRSVNLDVDISYNSGRGPWGSGYISTAAFYARAQGLFPGLGSLKETKMSFKSCVISPSSGCSPGPI